MVNYHDTLDRTFAALADPTRRALIARLGEQDGVSVSELARPFPVSLPGIMKHLDVLSEAGLIARQKTGRTVTCRLTAETMEQAMAWLHRRGAKKAWGPFKQDELNVAARAVIRRFLGRHVAGWTSVARGDSRRDRSTPKTLQPHRGNVLGEPPSPELVLLETVLFVRVSTPPFSMAPPKPNPPLPTALLPPTAVLPVNRLFLTVRLAPRILLTPPPAPKPTGRNPPGSVPPSPPWATLSVNAQFTTVTEFSKNGSPKKSTPTWPPIWFMMAPPRPCPNVALPSAFGPPLARL